MAGEAPHPDAIADQKMIESAVQRFEEGASVSAIVGLRNLSGGVIEALIAPGVIAGKHMIAGQHGGTPDQGTKAAVNRSCRAKGPPV